MFQGVLLLLGGRCFFDYVDDVADAMTAQMFCSSITGQAFACAESAGYYIAAAVSDYWACMTGL